MTAALDVLAGRRDIDLDRVGAVGVSLGGYYAPRAAAGEPRIQAVAGVSGPFNFGECWDGLPPLTRETFRHHSGAADDEEAREKALELDLGPVIGGAPPAGTHGHRQARPASSRGSRRSRIAAAAPNAEFVLYEEGTHVCNNVPYKYRPLVADWIRKELADVG